MPAGRKCRSPSHRTFALPDGGNLPWETQQRPVDQHVQGVPQRKGRVLPVRQRKKLVLPVQQRKGRLPLVQQRKRRLPLVLQRKTLKWSTPWVRGSWVDTPASPVGVYAVRPQGPGHHGSGSRIITDRGWRFGLGSSKLRAEVLGSPLGTGLGYYPRISGVCFFS